MAAPVPAAAPGLFDAAFSSAPVANNSAPAQGANQDMFDNAFGAPDSSPFGVPPVAMVQRLTQTHIYTIYSVTVIIINVICDFLLSILQQTAGQTSASTAAFGDPFGNPFA